jgi:hypothetical protein
MGWTTRLLKFLRQHYEAVLVVALVAAVVVLALPRQVAPGSIGTWFGVVLVVLALGVLGVSLSARHEGQPGSGVRLHGPASAALWVPIVAGWLALALYSGATTQGRGAFAVGFLASGGALAAGAFTGFLFGIPRAISGAERPVGSVASGPGATYRVNTNLEQISDWLTKILVGVGLVQLSEIAAGARNLIGFVAAGLNPGGPSDSDAVVAASLLLYYCVVGFVVGYVTTRTVLLQLFQKSELIDVEALVVQADRSVVDWISDRGGTESQLRAVLASTPEWYLSALTERVQNTKNTTRNASEADRASRLLTILKEPR